MLELTVLVLNRIQALPIYCKPYRATLYTRKVEKLTRLRGVWVTTWRLMSVWTPAGEVTTAHWLPEWLRDRRPFSSPPTPRHLSPSLSYYPSFFLSKISSSSSMLLRLLCLSHLYFPHVLPSFSPPSLSPSSPALLLLLSSPQLDLSSPLPLCSYLFQLQLLCQLLWWKDRKSL